MTGRLKLKPGVRSALRVVAVACSLPLAIATSPALGDTPSSCSSPTLSQPFSPWGDYNWYTLVPGQSERNFDGAGWYLGNGAQLETTRVYGGGIATVLNLPSGAWATSPVMCVAPSYPTARTMIRDLSGPPGVTLLVWYRGSSGSWTDPVVTGSLSGSRGWAPSRPVQIDPPSTSAWSLGRFTLQAGWTGGTYEIYDFYVDPYSRG
jgi:hypothetical protein